jgi:hypothetical protein
VIGGYRVVLLAYCGMTFPHGDPGMDRDEARQEVARLIRRRRREGFPVTTHTRGSTWEVMEPEDTMMVPDECGTLLLIIPENHDDEGDSP